MASKFQNRLVGTVILVALVVIFLPDLMDGNKLEQKDEAFAKIPLRPELEPAKPALQVSAASTLPAEQLARELGIKRPTLLYHFPTYRDLVGTGLGDLLADRRALGRKQREGQGHRLGRGADAAGVDHCAGHFGEEVHVREAGDAAF